jgi:hypothetical protein
MQVPFKAAIADLCDWLLPQNGRSYEVKTASQDWMRKMLQGDLALCSGIYGQLSVLKTG